MTVFAGGLTAVAALAGVAIGAAFAAARVPRLRWKGLALTGALAVVLAWVGVWAGEQPLLNALVFVGAGVVTSPLVAARLWQLAMPERELGYWGWVRRDLTHPRWLRDSYRDRS